MSETEKIVPVGQPRLVVPWPDEDDYDGETAQLYRTVDQDWSFQFPGWKWVANQINAEYGNNRTAAACRSKWIRWVKAQFIRHNANCPHAGEKGEDHE
jgi:hypothetical protein